MRLGKLVSGGFKGGGTAADGASGKSATAAEAEAAAEAAERAEEENAELLDEIQHLRRQVSFKDVQVAAAAASYPPSFTIGSLAHLRLMPSRSRLRSRSADCAARAGERCGSERRRSWHPPGGGASSRR